MTFIKSCLTLNNKYVIITPRIKLPSSFFASCISYAPTHSLYGSRATFHNTHYGLRKPKENTNKIC